MYPEENGYIHIISRFACFVNSPGRISCQNFLYFSVGFYTNYTKGHLYDPKYIAQN